MAITQHETDFGGHFAQQGWGGVEVLDIRRSQHSLDGKPDSRNNGDHMQFPAVDPAVPAGFGKVGLRYQSQYGGFPLSRGASDARRPHENVAPYYRWQLLVHTWPMARSARSDDDLESQSEQARPWEWLLSAVPRCDAMEHGLARLGTSRSCLISSVG